MKSNAAFALLAATAWGSHAMRDVHAPPPDALVPRQDRYDRIILRSAQSERLNPRLVKAIIAAESGFQPRAVSPKGARGLMQVMPDTAEEMGVESAELWQAEPNLRAGTSYLHFLYKDAWKTYGLEGVRFADGPPWAQRAVIAAYHGGPSLLHGRAWPRATVLYVRDVTRYLHSSAAGLRPALGLERMRESSTIRDR